MSFEVERVSNDDDVATPAHLLQCIYLNIRPRVLQSATFSDCLLEFPSTDMILPSQETVGNCIWLQLIKIRTKTVNSFSIIIELLTSAFIEFYLKDRLNQPAYIENPCTFKKFENYENLRRHTRTNNYIVFICRCRCSCSCIFYQNLFLKEKIN